MADDLIAACKDDPLVHSSVLADLPSGLVEGAIFVGATALLGTGVGAVVGLGLAIGAMTSGLPEKLGNMAGNAVDGVIGALGLRGAAGRQNKERLRQREHHGQTGRTRCRHR
ncbi:hypothetical protein V2I52_24105 [Brenneria sp. g21c3]|uniref:hypothetical protein n=1 Tax=Brenneria sp. g21c3 TaxID=3093893 RepID=UPI002EA3A972|nr:hypothetical protein [Brenneria sp. g21c3]